MPIASSQPHPRLHLLSVASGFVPLMLGAVVLVGWWQGLSGLIRLNPQWAAMQPITAMCMVLSGIGVLATTMQERFPVLRLLGVAVAVLAMAAAGTTIANYALGYEFGLFDSMLFPTRVAAQDMRFPGRMSGATAMEFILLGMAVTIRCLRARPAVPVAYGTIAAAGALIAAIAVLGYAFALTALYGVPAYTTMAFHTAAGLLIAFLGLLTTCPSCPLIKLTMSTGIGGSMARRLLPLVFGTPIVLAGIILAAAHALGWLLGFPVIVLVVVMIPLLQAGVVAVAFRIDRLDEEREKAIRAAQEARQQAELANQAKTQFLASASHDLRQPVQSLMLFYELLQSARPGLLPARVKEGMSASIDALKQLLDGLLDMSRIDAGIIEVKPEAVALAPLLARLEAEHASRAATAGLRFRIVPSSLVIRTDEALLEQMLGKLIDNAIRFTAQGGIVVGVRRTEKWARIVVADSGIGIPPDQQVVIFEDFCQLANPERDRSKGLGLGLAVVKRLARVLGHEVGVKSTPDHGSRFSIQAEVVGCTAVAPAPASPAKPLHPGLILVIDDDPLVLASMESVLERFGFQVAMAASADQAVIALEREGTAPQLILADYRLRHGQVGTEAIRVVRARFGADIPGLVITGDTGPERLAEAKASGFGLLHKPVAAETLYRAIMAAIEPNGSTLKWA